MAPQTPDQLHTTEQIIAEIGSAQGLSPEEMTRAREDLDKVLGEKTRVVSATKDQLSALAGDIKRLPPEATQQRKIDATVVAAVRAIETQKFAEELLEGAHDFMKDDDDATETATNDVYKKTCDQVTGLFLTIPQDAPIGAQREWMQLVSKYVRTRLAEDKNAWGQTDELKVDKIIGDIFDKQKSGVGAFKEWFDATHPQESKSLADLTKSKETLRNDVARARGEVKRLSEFPNLGNRFTELEKAIKEATDASKLPTHNEIADLIKVGEAVEKSHTDALAMQQKVLTFGLLATAAVQKLVSDYIVLITQSNGNNLKDLQDTLAQWNTRIALTEKLRTDIEGKNLASTEFDPLLSGVLEGTKTEAEVQGAIERKTKESTEAEAAKKTVEEAKLQVAEQDMTFIDRMTSWTGGEGIFGSIMTTLGLHKLVQIMGNALEKFAVQMANNKQIGTWARTHLISNRVLAEKYKDPVAVGLLKVENEMLKFSLAPITARTLANKYGAKPAKEVFALLVNKPGDVAKSSSELPALQKLHEQMKAKGAATSTKNFAEFIAGNTSWTNIDYSTPQPVVPPPAPAPAPATSTEAAPAPQPTPPATTPPTVPEAAPAQPTPSVTPPAPVSTPSPQTPTAPPPTP